MTEKVRTVRSGIVGLDLALGGGFRLLRRTRMDGPESATILIRGGPGTGKSVLAEDVALRVARALGSDVLYACIEVLPSEVIAQRMGFDGFDPGGVVDLSEPRDKDPGRVSPTLVLGMRDIAADTAGEPDLGQVLIDLSRISTEYGYNPKVVVVDSLSEGYGLGPAAPRTTVDGLCKLAIEQGWVLILVEEAQERSVSPWMFALDTVLSLRIEAPPSTARARRQLAVTKHRFGGCEPGPHRLQIERSRIRIIPPFHAYRNAARDLELPPPAKGRSLRIPAEETTPAAAFEIPDDQGVLLALVCHPPYSLAIAKKIGRLTSDGRVSSHDQLLFNVSEGNSPEPSQPHQHIVDAPLDEFIDGEEWLEAAVTQLAKHPAPTTAVSVGPTENLEKSGELDNRWQAVTLFTNILQRRGLLVVLFGWNVYQRLRHTTGRRWSVVAADPPAKTLTITASIPAGAVFHTPIDSIQ